MFWPHYVEPIKYNEVANLPAELYTNLYNTYVEGRGQVPGKKYIFLYTAGKLAMA